MKDVCVIIPFYKNSLSEFEQISFDRIVKIFSSRIIYLLSPFNNEKSAELVCDNRSNFNVALFDDNFFLNISGYNNLMMDYEFYDYFSEFKYILICQLDVFVIKDDLDYWIEQKFDNIGAPIFEGYTNDKTFKIKEQGSNGGFCLRSTQSCMKALLNLNKNQFSLFDLWNMETIWYWKIFRIFRDGIFYNSKFLKLKLNEDMFWSVIVPSKLPWFKVCMPSEAKYFAFDAKPKYLFELCNYVYPMAIHAWWRYDKPFVTQIIQELND